MRWRLAGLVVPFDQQIENLEAKRITKCICLSCKHGVMCFHAQSIAEIPLTFQEILVYDFIIPIKFEMREA